MEWSCIRSFAGLCLLATFVYSQGAHAQGASAQQIAQRGQYWVSFKIVAGKLAVDQDTFHVAPDQVKFEPAIRATVRQALAQIPPLSPSLLIDSTWAKYIPLYENWSAADSTRIDLGTLFSSDFLFANLLKNAPDFGLILNDEEIDPLDGAISFSIPPPFDAKAVQIELPAMLESERQTRIPELRKRLAHLNGSLWSSAAIRTVLAPFYANLGLTPQIVIFASTDAIQIVEGPRIASIILPSGQVPARDVNRLLWLLLDTRHFRQAKGKRTVDYDRDLGYVPGAEPYLIQYQLQELQFLISPFGYTVSAVAGARTGASQYVDLLVASTSKGRTKKKSRMVAAGFEYNPGQDFSALASLQLPPLAVSIGGPSGTLASGSYSAEYLGLSAALTAGISEERNRVLDGIRVNEQSIRDSSDFVWEPWRGLDGDTLRFHLDPNHAVVFNQTLNTLEPGVRFVHNNLTSEYPWRFSIGSRALIDDRFADCIVTANAHRSFDHWEYDLSGRFENAFGNSPIFELPSFGGENTVRGFRADDAIGRRLWASQNELWHALPRLSVLKLATFFDLGGAYQTVGSSAGLRVGLGTGLRLDLRLAVLKFDWAYGFGQAATGGSRGKFYFTVAWNTPH